MDLSIIIVNWNVRELLLKCLESIFKYTTNLSFEIIVIDNASNDGSTGELRRVFQPQIQTGQLLIIDNRGNNGFSRANNQGIKEAKGKYLLFLNPDTELIENTALKLKNFWEQQKNIGLLTCTLIYSDKTIQPNVKANPSLKDQLWLLLKLHHFWQPKFFKKYLAKEFDYQTTTQVQQIAGALIFTTRELMENLNGWDESYWLWWEDVDLCKRVQALNLDIIYAPISEVIHFESKSFAQVLSYTKQKRFIKSLLNYFKKYQPKAAYYLLAIIAPLSLGLAYLVQLLKFKPVNQSRL